MKLSSISHSENLRSGPTEHLMIYTHFQVLPSGAGLERYRKTESDEHFFHLDRQYICGQGEETSVRH